MPGEETMVGGDDPLDKGSLAGKDCFVPHGHTVLARCALVKPFSGPSESPVSSREFLEPFRFLPEVLNPTFLRRIAASL